MESTRQAVGLRGALWGQGWDLGLLRDALGRGSLLTCTKKMGRGPRDEEAGSGRQQVLG